MKQEQINRILNHEIICNLDKIPQEETRYYTLYYFLFLTGDTRDEHMVISQDNLRDARIHEMELTEKQFLIQKLLICLVMVYYSTKDLNSWIEKLLEIMES